MKKFFVVGLLLLSIQANAEGGVSGHDGGHGVVCEVFSQGLKSKYTVQLLDLFEQASLDQSHSKLKVQSGGITSIRNLPRVTCKLLAEKQAVAEKLFGHHRELFAFNKACSLVKAIKLTDYIYETEDYGYLRASLPKACKLVQIANRMVTPNGESISIDYRIANYLGSRDLAALLLHEALHEYRGGQTTIEVRKYVGAVFSEK